MILLMILFGSLPSSFFGRRNLLVEGLGVGGGGRNVGVTGGLVGAGGELELVGGLQVGVAGGAVGGGVILQKKSAERKKPQEGDEVVGWMQRLYVSNHKNGMR